MLEKCSGISLPPTPAWSGYAQATCRAGAIVLLVGFWFDGGLFKLPVSAVFWSLIELGRVRWPVAVEAANLPAKPCIPAETACVLPVPKTASWLRWLAGILAALALIQTLVHWGTPWLPVNDKTLAVARKCLVSPKQRADFEYLASQPIWSGEKLQTLLDHVELAVYNRELINWTLDEAHYRDYVLNPVIVEQASRLSAQSPEPKAQSLPPLSWRRSLWEEFYPRIRHENSPADAVPIVARQLRERITIADQPGLPHTVPEERGNYRQSHIKKMIPVAGWLQVPGQGHK